jgi:hypothetical protein
MHPESQTPEDSDSGIAITAKLIKLNWLQGYRHAGNRLRRGEGLGLDLSLCVGKTFHKAEATFLEREGGRAV